MSGKPKILSTKETGESIDQQLFGKISKTLGQLEGFWSLICWGMMIRIVVS